MKEPRDTAEMTVRRGSRGRRRGGRGRRGGVQQVKAEYTNGDEAPDDVAEVEVVEVVEKTVSRRG